MVRLTLGFAVAAIFAAAGCDLNAGDFISRGMEGVIERVAKSIGWRRRKMEACNWSASHQYPPKLYHFRRTNLSV
jgi:hypothetical protein